MFSISTFVKKIKGQANFRPALRPLSDDLFLGLIIVLVAFGSFGLGRLSKIEGLKTPIQIENVQDNSTETLTRATKTGEGQIATPPPAMLSTSESTLVGSKTGKKYHYTWCSGAQRIAEANRVYFSSKDDAEMRGYTPASNCKGL